MSQRLIEIMAAERSHGDPHLYDELLQEGMIAAWRASQREHEKDAYLYIAARYRMGDVLKGKPLTGEVGRRGWSDAHDKVIGPLLDDDGEPVFEDRCDWSAADSFLSVEIRDDVMAAVASLPDERDRQAVYLRFWEGWSYPELAQEQSLSRSSLERRWRTVTRPFLAERLEHLKEVAA